MERRAPNGAPFRAWEREVPRIEDRLLNAVVYMYADVGRAETGLGAGGSGFLVGQPTEDGRLLLYVVTCAHVVEGGCPVVRFGGDPASRVINQYLKWHFAAQDDLAIALAAVVTGQVTGEAERETTIYPWDWLQRSWFATEDDVKSRAVDEEAANHGKARPWPGPWIGVGDETVLIGRYLAYDGVESNEPTVRFGNLSAPRPVDLERKSGVFQSSFLVEMRSLPGYSGSPVIHYHDTSIVGGWMAPIPNPRLPERMRLLGIDYGEMIVPAGARPHEFKVHMCMPGDASENRLRSGIMVVVPAWRIGSLIDSVATEDLRMFDEREPAVEQHSPELSEFDAFQEMTHRLVQVPKSEIDEQRAQE